MKKGIIIKLVLAAVLIVVGVFGLVYNSIIVYTGDLKYFGYRDMKVSVSSVQTTPVEDKMFYQAFFNYEIDNTSYSYSSNLTSDESKYVVGQEVVIRYNPKNPVQCNIKEKEVLYNYLFLGISCIILIIGIKLFDKQFRTN